MALVTAPELEAWVRRVVSAVQAGNDYEDSLVELKFEWPEVDRFAPRLAGHANAMSGHELLWIIGLSEGGDLRTVTRDAATWWPPLQKRFDGPAPRLDKTLHVQIGNETLTALLFEANAAPYILVNPAGLISRWMPWREATATRAANRSEVLRVLEPVVLAPEIAVVPTGIEWLTGQPTGNDDIDWDLRLGLEIRPRSHHPVVFTSNSLQRATFVLNSHDRPTVNFSWHTSASEPSPFARGADVVFDRPGSMEIMAFNQRTQSPLLQPEDEITVEIEVLPVGAQIAANTTVSMVRQPHDTYWGFWVRKGSRSIYRP